MRCGVIFAKLTREDFGHAPPEIEIKGSDPKYLIYVGMKGAKAWQLIFGLYKMRCNVASSDFSGHALFQTLFNIYCHGCPVKVD